LKGIKLIPQKLPCTQLRVSGIWTTCRSIIVSYLHPAWSCTGWFACFGRGEQIVHVSSDCYSLLKVSARCNKMDIWKSSNALQLWFAHWIIKHAWLTTRVVHQKYSPHSTSN